jgi:hypothetical protein
MGVLLNVRFRCVSGFTFTALSTGNLKTTPGNTEDVCPIAQIGFINHRYIENKRNREIKFVLPNARLISEMKVFTCLHKGPGNKFFPIFFM